MHTDNMHIDALPGELLREVLSHLPFSNDLGRCACVCRGWRRLEEKEEEEEKEKEGEEELRRKGTEESDGARGSGRGEKGREVVVKADLPEGIPCSSPGAKQGGQTILHFVHAVPAVTPITHARAHAT
eukprot:jgi/Chlat1/3462/Chrsp23S03830